MGQPQKYGHRPISNSQRPGAAPNTCCIYVWLTIAAGGRVIDGEAEELAEDDERLTLQW